MDSLSILILLIPALPLAAAIVTAVLGPRLIRGASHWPAAIAIFTAILCSLLLVREVGRQSVHADGVGFEHVCTLWRWATVPDAYMQQPAAPTEQAGTTGWGPHDFTIDISLRVDSLTAVMLATVNCVSFLVVVFARGYMQGDRGYWRFFTYVSLFVFSMAMLVSVSNLLLLYVFWEAVGVCSYLLIGFWYEKPKAAAAGKKAFLVNRVGDFGFALGLFLIWTTYGTLNFHDISSADQGIAHAESKDDLPVGERDERGVIGQQRLRENDFVGGPLGVTIGLLLLLGACGKSAQFPLHVWLPDAMEGPTPVSALIHAATMVTAGVYMIVRFAPLYLAAPESLLVVAIVGGVTALMAGIIALTQTDLKRVLAYSTISQLGYMFLAVGTGSLAGITAGMFHLFTHAFFKALLFLGAGSVMHAMGGVIDMRHFSGLRKLMPVTYVTFMIGCLALTGLPPFAGFWSKDAILGALHDKIHSSEHGMHEDSSESSLAATPVIMSSSHVPRARPVPVTSPSLSPTFVSRIYQLLYYAAVLTAFLTAFYTARAFFLTFHGPFRVPDEAGHHAHESPGSMCLPLIALAVCAALAGMAFDWSWLQSVQLNYFANYLLTTPSLAHETARATQLPGNFHVNIAVLSTCVALAGVGLGAFLYLGRQTEVKWLGSRLSRIGFYQLSWNKFYIDEIYDWCIVWPLRGCAALSYFVDRWVVDGMVNLVGRLPVYLGGTMRSLQLGFIPFYALAMVLGLLILIASQMMWAEG